MSTITHMEKKTISVHAVNIHIYQIAIVVLVLLIGVLGAKYLHLKWSVANYTASTIWMNQQNKPTGQVSDYGIIIAESSSEIPSDQLQNYVTNLSKALNRDIVVLDVSEKILADTVPANKGTIYNSDANNVIKETLSDGKTRVFEEKSTDYPNGILEVVVPVKNANSQITGAVLVSNSEVFH